MVGAPMILSSRDDLDMFGRGEYPEGIKEVTDVAVVGAFGPTDKRCMSSSLID